MVGYRWSSRWLEAGGGTSVIIARAAGGSLFRVTRGAPRAAAGSGHASIPTSERGWRLTSVSTTAHLVSSGSGSSRSSLASEAAKIRLRLAIRRPGNYCGGSWLTSSAAGSCGSGAVPPTIARGWPSVDIFLRKLWTCGFPKPGRCWGLRISGLKLNVRRSPSGMTLLWLLWPRCWGAVVWKDSIANSGVVQAPGFITASCVYLCLFFSFFPEWSKRKWKHNYLWEIIIYQLPTSLRTSEVLHFPWLVARIVQRMQPQVGVQWFGRGSYFQGLGHHRQFALPLGRMWVLGWMEFVSFFGKPICPDKNRANFMPPYSTRLAISRHFKHKETCTEPNVMPYKCFSFMLI